MSYQPTYDDLSAEILVYTEDTSDELIAEIPKIINRAEMAILRDLDLDMFKKSETGALAIGDPLYTLTVGATSFKLIDVWAAGKPLLQRSEDFVRMLAGATQAQPKYQAREGETQIRVAPVPDQAYAIEERWRTRPTALATGNQTNWLTLNVGDLLLLKCMMESEHFLIDAERMAAFSGMYDRLLPGAQFELRRMSSDEYSPTRSASKPSLKPGE